MRPDHIILVRHGESEGNADKTLYEKIPDYAIKLTDKGKQQAKDAAAVIQKYIGTHTPVQFFCSPWWRTRQTYQIIAKNLDNPHKYYEDPRLREQEWGHLRSLEPTLKLVEERDAFGFFYYRFIHGENCGDVFDRVSSFLDTFWREVEKFNFPPNTVIVTHGMTLRVFLMRFMHWDVETFETLRNPHNCEVFVLKKVENTDKYELITEPRFRTELDHPYQYDWSELK